ncbi:hypothetical protein F3Y22_tig00117012pilonHSYRG00363 [Hibiscus syriacus]|uniref:DNA polymerase n=1 Tax=Hibiscus syriacus TaxID=106335 RepID=A0A6A2XI11_HIBSY|nr:hypothetical protein F3Y22_tig00117012pilonHSYRG00363 [Hibiscus syriacus]
MLLPPNPTPPKSKRKNPKSSKENALPPDPNSQLSPATTAKIKCPLSPSSNPLKRKLLTENLHENPISGASDSDALLHRVNEDQLARFKGHVLLCPWLEDSLEAGEKVSGDFYTLKVDSAGLDVPDKSQKPKLANRNSCDYDEQLNCKRIKPSPEEIKQTNEERKGDIEINSASATSDTEPHSPSSVPSSPENLSTQDKDVGIPTPLQHSPPDFNKDITEIFGKLVNIYRALGDDRISFSYYKAISVVEKLPFKIESADQVKGLSGIGKSMQDHILEIVTTGKLSKLGHFETDEKVRTISLFGEVWGVGPATTLKLFEKGHHTLNGLKNEDSLTNSQVIGVKYFDDIKTRIPRHEAQHMESLLQKVADGIVPGVHFSFVFAYGQTGSGKTYIIWGPANALFEENLSSDQQGLTPRVQHLFDRINEEQIKHADKHLKYQICYSFLEIYNEKVTDLLDPNQRNLQIREDVKYGVYVENLKEEYVHSMKGLTKLLLKNANAFLFLERNGLDHLF